jgi:hypothetical protein
MPMPNLRLQSQKPVIIGLTSPADAGSFHRGPTVDRLCQLDVGLVGRLGEG